MPSSAATSSMRESTLSLPSSIGVVTASSPLQSSSLLTRGTVPLSGASKEFMQALTATSEEPLFVSTKKKGSSLPPSITKRSKSSADAIVVCTTSGVMAPSPLDSNVQVSSTLTERDSRVLALSPLASFSYTNLYIPKKGPQAPRPNLPSSSAASLSLAHFLCQKGLEVLCQKGLEVPPASMQRSRVSLSFPGVVDNIDGDLAAMILDSIPREKDWRLAEAYTSAFLVQKAACLELQVWFCVFLSYVLT